MIEKYRILLLRELPPLVSPMRGLAAVILSPGSTKRDLNLLFLFGGGTFPSEEMFRVAKKLEGEVNRQFGEKLMINPVPKQLPELDKYFLAQILREGYVVYGGMPQLSAQELDLRPVTIVSYSLRNRVQQDKTRINYALYGRKLKKGKVEKTIPGLLQKAGGAKLGPGVVLLPDSSKSEVISLLEREKLPYSEKKVWTNAKEGA